jgi:hypothetical protein
MIEWDIIYINLSFSDITTTSTPITNIPNQPCLVNPCLNGAYCSPVSGGGFRCICSTGYTGFLCDSPGSLLRGIDKWDINYIIHLFKVAPLPPPSTGCGINRPCLNSGVCILTPIGYQCQCLDNFSGRYCQINTGTRN